MSTVVVDPDPSDANLRRDGGVPASTGTPLDARWSDAHYLIAVTGTTIGPCSTDGAENAGLVLKLR